MSDALIAFSKGHEFRNPEKPDEGYRLKQTVYKTQAVMAKDFEAFGGAPTPVPSAPMPMWLAKLLSGHIHNYA